MANLFYDTMSPKALEYPRHLATGFGCKLVPEVSVLESADGKFSTKDCFEEVLVILGKEVKAFVGPVVVNHSP